MYRLIPLAEVLSEVVGVSANTKTVMGHYLNCVERFGSELNVLTQTPVEELARGYSPILAESIERMRQEKVIRKPGYDGAFGSISVFRPGEQEKFRSQDEKLVCRIRKTKTL